VSAPTSPSAFPASLQTNNIQASDSTIGAAMGLIKKIDVPRHFAARRADRRLAARCAIQPHGNEIPVAEPDCTAASGANFQEDFLLEHSSARALVVWKDDRFVPGGNTGRLDVAG